MEALSKAGIDIADLKVKAFIGSNEAIKYAVGSGLGISFVSDISIRKEIGRGELAALHIKGVNLSRQFYLAQRSGRELSPAAAAFAEILMQMYGLPESDGNHLQEEKMKRLQEI